MTIFILLLIGLMAGSLSGLVGLGGGVVIVPALIYFLGMSQHMAQGTSLAVMLPPIGILAVMNYYKSGYVDMKSALILSGAFIIGGFLGSKVAIALPPQTIKKVFGIVVLLVGLKMIFSK
jgi:uncharacterized membrane protein YfcA